MALLAKWNKANSGKEKNPAEGRYPSTIEKVSAEYGVYTQGREVDRIAIRYLLDNGVTITQKYIWYLSDISKLGQVVTNLLGDVSHDVDLEDLQGMRCEVKIEHNRTDDGKVWVNVTEVHTVMNEPKSQEDVETTSQEEPEQQPIVRKKMITKRRE